MRSTEALFDVYQAYGGIVNASPGLRDRGRPHACRAAVHVSGPLYAPSHQQVVLHIAPAALRCEVTLPTASFRCQDPFALTDTTFMVLPSSDCQTMSVAPELPNFTAVFRTIHGKPCSCRAIVNR